MRAPHSPFTDLARCLPPNPLLLPSPSSPRLLEDGRLTAPRRPCQVLRLREREFQLLRRDANWGVLAGFLWAGSPIVVALATFGAYAASGQPLRPNIAFTALALFNVPRLHRAPCIAPCSVHPLRQPHGGFTIASLSSLISSLQNLNARPPGRCCASR